MRDDGHIDDLLARWNLGDAAAAEEAILACEAYVRMVVRRRLSGRARTKFDSMDIVQSVWAGVIRELHQAGLRFPDADRLRGYLAKAAYHRLIDHLRQHRTALDVERPLTAADGAYLTPSREPRPSEIAQADDLWERMWTLCPPVHRELLELKRQGLPLAVIAANGPARRERPPHPLRPGKAGGLRSVPSQRKRGSASGFRSRLEYRNRGGPTMTPLEAQGTGTDMDPGSPPGCSGLTSAVDPVEALAERLAVEMALAWEQGQHPSAEEVLARHRELRDHPRAALRLIYEEICLREDSGQVVGPDEMLDRFPDWRDELEKLLLCHQVMGPPAEFPEAGDVLAGFRLLAELGRGALGRVFLAAQTDLANRPVVLKLTPCGGEEHLTLARLQHTHIIPINGVQDDPARGLARSACHISGGRLWSVSWN